MKPELPFKFLTREEFDRLSNDERFDYLRRAEEALRRQSEELREFAKRFKNPRGQP